MHGLRRYPLLLIALLALLGGATATHAQHGRHPKPAAARNHAAKPVAGGKHGSAGKRSTARSTATAARSGKHDRHAATARTAAHATRTHERVTRPVPTTQRTVRRDEDLALIARHADSLALRFLPCVRRALARIPQFDRRLLAMKYYLNRPDSVVEAKWAWDAAEIAAFRRSAAYGETRAELGRIERMFAEQNPGYELDVHMEIRTLGDQIGKWNNVTSIGAGARELMARCRTAVADTVHAFDSMPTPTSLQAFVEMLRAFEPSRVPSVAVPGLSQHGQLRAFDFRILRGGRLVAGSSIASIASAWDRAGWTAALYTAICTVSDRFEGPLNEPYEPWHYTFLPPANAELAFVMPDR